MWKDIKGALWLMAFVSLAPVFLWLVERPKLLYNIAQGAIRVKRFIEDCVHGKV